MTIIKIEINEKVKNQHNRITIKKDIKTIDINLDKIKNKPLTSKKK